MREQYQRVASGVSVPTVSGHAGRVPPASRPALKYSMKYVDVAPAAVLGTELDTLDAALAGVTDRIALQTDVRVAIECQRQIEPLALVAPFESQQRLADLVLEMQIAAAGEDEERYLAGFDSDRRAAF